MVVVVITGFLGASIDIPLGDTSNAFSLLLVSKTVYTRGASFPTSQQNSCICKLPNKFLELSKKKRNNAYTSCQNHDCLYNNRVATLFHALSVFAMLPSSPESILVQYNDFTSAKLSFKTFQIQTSKLWTASNNCQ